MTIHTMMTADESGKELVELAQQLAQTLVDKKLSRSQIRNIFTEARQIEALWEKEGEHEKEALRRLILLKPKLAYQAGRDKSVKLLQEKLNEAIDVVSNAPAGKQKEYFMRFMDFFEAVLAYHKAYGGN